MKVYQAINAVQAELATTGISKTRNNAQQGYKFRGIDDMYNVVAPVLAKHKLLVLPHFSDRGVVERATAKGGVLFYVTVTGRFEFISAEDGTKHEVTTYGEAMDSADKATNKAMSAAYKYALMQAFAIPTEGDNDADGTTHEVAPIPQEHVIAIESAESIDELAAAWQRIPAEFRKPLTKAKDAAKTRLLKEAVPA